MQILIDIPDEQIKKSLEESKYIHEDEGEKGFVNIAMLYTNARLEFVDVERKTDFYSCKYKILPKGHGRLMILSEDAIKRERVPMDCSCQLWISDIGLSNATVAVIEADKDKAESEDKE